MDKKKYDENFGQINWNGSSENNTSLKEELAVLNYKKEFEEFLNKYPHLKGGNDFQMDGGEYASSWMRETYNCLRELIERVSEAEKLIVFYKNGFNVSRPKYMRQGEMVRNPRTELCMDGGDRAMSYLEKWNTK